MPLIQTAGLVTAGLLATTSLFTGAVPGADDAGPRVPCGAVWSTLPADLRTDLTAARKLPDGERRAALRSIRQDALDGEYGDRVQQIAERRHERVRAVRQLLPADLASDLREARDLTGETRVDAYEAIRDGALAGEYGDRVQRVAEAVQERREECGAS
jgi:hypothetical protein